MSNGGDTPVGWYQFAFVVTAIVALLLGSLRIMWADLQKFRERYEKRHDRLRREIERKIEKKYPPNSSDS